MGWVYPNSLGMEMSFDFSSPLGRSRVTGKYIGVGYGDREGKTNPQSAPLPCLLERIFCKLKLLNSYLQYLLYYKID